MIIGMVMLSFSIMFSIIFCILQKSHQELSTNWAMRRTISVIDPNASLNISRALTGAPQAVIEITTSYKIKSYRTRSVDNISLATKPPNAISETQRCIFNFQFLPSNVSQCRNRFFCFENDPFML